MHSLSLIKAMSSFSEAIAAHLNLKALPFHSIHAGSIKQALADTVASLLTVHDKFHNLTNPSCMMQLFFHSEIDAPDHFLILYIQKLPQYYISYRSNITTTKIIASDIFPIRQKYKIVNCKLKLLRKKKNH